ncbi:hypothetical protein RIF29_10267 [Crotalaria pallida]|uniref:Inactive poly [ADP-ribose] polymerase SRO5 n=1 Tax=Crotalaria pallida TaxID=3830 RepID=A0AAN9IJT4_CROPI
MNPTFNQIIFATSPSNNEDDSVVSDCESVVSGAGVMQHHQQQQQQRHGGVMEMDEGVFVRLEEDDVLRKLITKRFLRGLGDMGLETKTEVLAIHRNSCSSVMAQARVRCFQVYAQAVAKLRGGVANVKYAWYGTRGEEEIREIVSHGFGHAPLHRHHRLCLYPDDSPLQSVKNSVADKDGVRHLLLCRVILGRTEVVHPGTEQCYPSSEDFDSGVDNFSAPNKYIIWSSRMNTHVLPAYVISFRVPSFTGIKKRGEPSRPSSPWLPFPTLISVLSKVLRSPDIALISKFHRDHKERKISRSELINKVREIAGDKLLIAAIKSHRAKKKDSRFLQARSKNCSRTVTNVDGMNSFI